MSRFRRRRLRTRLSLLAMVALLWSQLVFAAHPDCLAGPPRMAPAMASMPNCPMAVQVKPSPVCQAHCDQGGLSSDVARVPPVPQLPATLAMPLLLVLAGAPQDADAPRAHAAGPPWSASWHRPTAHPAALLLI